MAFKMKSDRARKIWKWLFLAAVLVAVGLQFANPSLKNPTAEPGGDLMATNPPPPEIASLLRGACYDCHSVETKWPWYSRVAPVSLWVMDHVKEGRQKLNFSEWPHADPVRARKKLTHIGDAVRDGDMPLPSYGWIHSAARLTTAQRELLAAWADQAAQRLGKAEE